MSASSSSFVQQASQLRGVVVEQLPEVTEELDSPVVARDGGFLEEFLSNVAYFGGRPGIEGLPAPDTERFVARCFAVTARTGLRPDRVGGILLDVEAVNLREFAVGVLGEDRDVAAGDATPADHPW